MRSTFYFVMIFGASSGAGWGTRFQASANPLKSGKITWSLDGLSSPQKIQLHRLSALVYAALPSVIKNGIRSSVQIKPMRSANSTLTPKCIGKGNDSSLISFRYFADGRAIIKINPEALTPLIPYAPTCGKSHILEQLESEILNALLYTYYKDLVYALGNSHWLPQFSHLADYSRRGLIFSHYTKSNPPNSKHEHLLLEPIETSQNPFELFALYGEYFLTDPTFRCRKPAMGAFLEKHLEVKGYPSQCQISFNVPLNPYMQALTSPQNKAPLTTLPTTNLDPSRIYAIHYLLAAKSKDSWVSRFGHAGFRLIICGPETPFGPQCEEDTEYHVAISFRANVMDLVLDYWKGLSGQYTSELFIFSFLDTLREYQIMQDRSLESYPIDLTTNEKNTFVYRVLEMIWGYSNDYYFVTNNCAVEAESLLKSALDHKQTPQNKAFCSERSLSPIGLKEELADSGLIDLAPVESRFFKSSSRTLTPAFEAVKSELKWDNIRYKQYRDLSATRRKSLYDQSINSGIKPTKQVLMSLRHFEKRIAEQLDLNWIKESGKLLLEELEKSNSSLSKKTQSKLSTLNSNDFTGEFDPSIKKEIDEWLAQNPLIKDRTKEIAATVSNYQFFDTELKARK